MSVREEVVVASRVAVRLERVARCEAVEVERLERVLVRLVGDWAGAGVAVGVGGSSRACTVRGVLQGCVVSVCKIC